MRLTAPGIKSFATDLWVPLLIRCLQDHIASLEKQLDEKQIIIEENTKIIANLISIHIEGNGKHTGLHDNQLLQSQSLKQYTIWKRHQKQ